MSPPTPPSRALRSTASAQARSLQPAFRERLIDALDQGGIPPPARQAYVVSLTSRAPQTVSRWLDPTRPGLPDLESLARLCEGLRCSSDLLLDLRLDAIGPVSPAVDAEQMNWAREIFQSLRCEAPGCSVIRMPGDEMAPTIRPGDAVFVDQGLQRILGNGIYALQLSGRIVVRRVEAGLGAGLTLKCEQPGYREHVLEDEAAAARMGLRVIGKVFGVVGVTRF